MQIEAIADAVDCLEANLFWYLERDKHFNYIDKINKVKEELDIKVKQPDKDRQFPMLKKKYAKKKFKLLMGFIGHKGWLIEEDDVSIDDPFAETKQEKPDDVIDA